MLEVKMIPYCLRNHDLFSGQYLTEFRTGHISDVQQVFTANIHKSSSHVKRSGLFLFNVLQFIFLYCLVLA